MGKQINPKTVKWKNPSTRDVYFAIFVVSPILIWVVVKLFIIS